MNIIYLHFQIIAFTYVTLVLFPYLPTFNLPPLIFYLILTHHLLKHWLQKYFFQ